MRSHRRCVLAPACLLAAAALSVLPAAARGAAPAAVPASPAAADADGFAPLFNGKDLSGWVPVNVAPSTFTVRDGLIVSTGVPTGVMRTERMYENFVLEMEWMHLKPGGNAGLFVWGDALTAPGVPFARGIEVQILDEAYFNEEARARGHATGHGDVFAIHGATMVPDRPHPKGWQRSLPSEKRANPAGQWNHYRVECVDGTIKLAVNGKVVSGGTKCNPRKGYLCLESEGGQVHYRNLRIKELPGSNPKPEEIARADEGFKSIYTGTDLSGWAEEPGHKGHWRAKDWTLDYDGASTAADKTLWTEKDYGDVELIVDWRLPREPKKARLPDVPPGGITPAPPAQVFLDAGRSGIALRGSAAEITLWSRPEGSGGVPASLRDAAAGEAAPVRPGLVPRVRADRPPGLWNRFVITLRGDRLTVVLNGQTVTDNATVPGLPARGKLGLRHHGDPVQFGNLYVKELAGDRAAGGVDSVE